MWISHGFKCAKTLPAPCVVHLHFAPVQNDQFRTITAWSFRRKLAPLSRETPLFADAGQYHTVGENHCVQTGSARVQQPHPALFRRLTRPEGTVTRIQSGPGSAILQVLQSP